MEAILGALIGLGGVVVGAALGWFGAREAARIQAKASVDAAELQIRMAREIAMDDSRRRFREGQILRLSQHVRERVASYYRLRELAEHTVPTEELVRSRDASHHVDVTWRTIWRRQMRDAITDFFVFDRQTMDRLVQINHQELLKVALDNLLAPLMDVATRFDMAVQWYLVDDPGSFRLTERSSEDGEQTGREPAVTESARSST
jgi:hypothetical protein